jgi:hypothetical protein
LEEAFAAGAGDGGAGEGGAEAGVSTISAIPIH